MRPTCDRPITKCLAISVNVYPCSLYSVRIIFTSSAVNLAPECFLSAGLFVSADLFSLHGVLVSVGVLCSQNCEMYFTSLSVAIGFAPSLLVGIRNTPYALVTGRL